MLPVHLEPSRLDVAMLATATRVPIDGSKVRRCSRFSGLQGRATQMCLVEETTFRREDTTRYKFRVAHATQSYVRGDVDAPA